MALPHEVGQPVLQKFLDQVLRHRLDVVRVLLVAGVIGEHQRHPKTSRLLRRDTTQHNRVMGMQHVRRKAWQQHIDKWRYRQSQRVALQRKLQRGISKDKPFVFLIRLGGVRRQNIDDMPAVDKALAKAPDRRDHPVGHGKVDVGEHRYVQPVSPLG